MHPARLFAGLASWDRVLRQAGDGRKGMRFGIESDDVARIVVQEGLIAM